MNSLATLESNMARAREAIDASQWTTAEVSLREILAQNGQHATALRLLATVDASPGTSQFGDRTGETSAERRAFAEVHLSWRLRCIAPNDSMKRSSTSPWRINCAGLDQSHSEYRRLA